MASWRGYLKLSLVACPIRLHPATTEAKNIRFHLINPATGNRIRMITVDADTGEEVARANLVKGYEFERSRYITVTNEELEKLQIESNKTIGLERFVRADEIDRLYFEKPYYVAPDGAVAQEAFKVIAEAMRRQKLAGLGRVVISQRERAVVVEPRGKGLLMTTLHSPEEVRSQAEYFNDITDEPVDPKMIEMAQTIIGQLKGRFEPSAYQDRYEAALRDLVESKIKGERPAAPQAESGAKVINLMDALKRSLGATERKGPAEIRRPARRARSTKAKRAPRKTG